MRLARMLVPLAATAGLWLASPGSVDAAGGGSGIKGRVVAGPTCPVETVPPQPRCAPRPLAARIRIRRLGGHAFSKTIKSAKDGYFWLRLPAGEYRVSPLARPGSPMPRPPAPFQVRVRAHRFTRITINYDTGIR